jgi:hypothetical protein
MIPMRQFYFRGHDRTKSFRKGNRKAFGKTAEVKRKEKCINATFAYLISPSKICRTTLTASRFNCIFMSYCDGNKFSLTVMSHI